jgi:hypothetical protein
MLKSLSVLPGIICETIALPGPITLAYMISVPGQYLRITLFGTYSSNDGSSEKGELRYPAG